MRWQMGSVLGGTSLVVGLALGTLVALAACSSSPPEPRPIHVFVPRACPLGDGAYAQYYGRGDFEPTAEDPSSEGRALGEEGPFPALRLDARTLLVDVSDTSSPGPFRGLSIVPTSGPVDVLLWPFDVSCTLSPRFGARDGTAFGLLDASRALVVGGRSPNGIPASFLVDLSRGTARALPIGLLAPREGPTVTPFGAGALVAGGRLITDGRPLDTAEIFDAEAGDFDGSLLVLGEPRAEHGAVVLGNGETLLVGGVDASGRVLRSLVAVDPAARRARTQGLTELEVARRRPTVLRLANGEILVAGGFDERGAPVEALEWLAPDGSRSGKRPRTLVATEARAFVALPAGGALAVLATEGRPPGFRNVWVVREDGVLEDAEPLPQVGATVALFEGSQGAPLLWTGDRWLRFQPWRGTFSSLPGAPASGPEALGAASATGNLALWLRTVEGELALAGLFFDTRGPFDAISGPLATTDTAFLAPDRLASASGSGAFGFDARGLRLEGGTTVLVTDTTYADVELSLSFPSRAPASLVLRSDDGRELVVGAGGCPWPSPPGEKLVVRRRWGQLTGAWEDGRRFGCADPLVGLRVRVLLRGPAEGTSLSRELRVQRLLPGR